MLNYWPLASRKALPFWLPSLKDFRTPNGARPYQPPTIVRSASIVHHVATVYPIEIDLARAIASGKAVTDVTWDVVAQLNAKHAEEQARHDQGRRSRTLAQE